MILQVEYAPPELNPPVEGASIFPGAVIGKSDIWSSGVVIYLLLVGHNPFHLASKLKDMQKVEQEVLRLVARGSFDKTCPAWTALSKDVKELLRAALTARPEHRASSRDVLVPNHVQLIFSTPGQKRLVAFH
ncbi:putative ribosomal protein S6 kinase alpha-2 [Symbiodinium microadriaticum]|uniref:Putative ribosomal protein S6 kinase alpha-2 n=1 Tax=Symbiodinium microadriaticum TaxID=2951 RepID=A0A1Q9DX70_SYMMI|nr:putative ribosomal protein S6 kinase alpha-2 [Symbiodinium microadriaticum]